MPPINASISPKTNLLFIDFIFVLLFSISHTARVPYAGEPAYGHCTVLAEIKLPALLGDIAIRSIAA
jgi:hypothetical protein